MWEIEFKHRYPVEVENHSQPNGLTATDFPLEICLHYFSLPIHPLERKATLSQSSVNRLLDGPFYLNREAVLKSLSCVDLFHS